VQARRQDLAAGGAKNQKEGQKPKGGPSILHADNFSLFW